ncbi:hypothetical protein GCM10022279_19680 [Comamonas faecalis]|uniref:EthD domain-containing protein n=1 Tax=Comamonas faecalis TaxID=1387849 RepID=A0ABP7RDY3_9BURK
MHDDGTLWKMIYLARRNPRLAPEDFAAAWREHSALGRNCTNVQQRVRSVAQCTRLLDALPDGCSSGFDGVNLMALRDRASADAIWSDPETLATMRPDEPRVFDRYVRECALVAREQVLHGGSGGTAGCAAVLTAFLKRRDRVAAEDFERALPLAPQPWSAVRASRLNIVEPGRPPGHDWDAVLEWWFEDAQQLVQSLAARPLRGALPLLYRTVCESGASLFLATRVSHRRP